MKRVVLAVLTLTVEALAALSVPIHGQSGYAASPTRKHVLAWADVRNGCQHDSISHAVADTLS